MKSFPHRLARVVPCTVAFLVLSATFVTGFDQNALAVAPPPGPATLYVLAGATGASCTSDTTSSACPTISTALSVLSASNTSYPTVTIDVGAGTFDENDVVDLPLIGNLTIEGQGSASTIVDGTNTGTVFVVKTGTVTITGVAIIDGFYVGSSDGGGGVINNANLTLSDDVLQSNSVDDYYEGGAVLNLGTLNASDDMFTANSVGNEGVGGAIANRDQATLTDDTFSDNTADTFSDGAAGASGEGGAIWNDGLMTANDDTFTGNDAGSNGFGGAIFNDGVLGVHFDTFRGNSSSSDAAIMNNDSLTLGDSLLDETLSCSGTPSVSDDGYNVESDNSCGFGNTSVVDASSIDLSSSLAVNSSTGPTTLALLPGSDAVEEVPSSGCVGMTDERGEPRPGVTNENCDAGAFELQQYTITYDSNPPDTNLSGTPSRASSTFFEGTINPTLATVGSMSDPGWTFAGWSTSSTSDDLPTQWEPDDNVTLYAVWTPDQETVTFDANGGTGGSTVQASYATTAALPSEPTYTGYTFEGWCDTQESPNASCADTALATTGDFTVPLSTTFYALWTPDQETIYFDWNDGLGIVESEPDTFGIPLGNVSPPSDSYYTFAGWCSVQESPNEACSGSTITIGTVVFPSITYYYALSTSDQETVTFDANGGTGGSTVQANYATSAALPSAPTYTGYTFEGWCSIAESPGTACGRTSYATSGSFTVPLSTTLYALWTPDQETVTFNPNGGTGGSTVQASYATTAALPNEPTYTGYTFEGWCSMATSPGSSCAGSSYNAAGTFTVPLSTTFYALWTPDQETVTFDANGGTGGSTVQANYATSAALPSAPTFTGYTFEGWCSMATSPGSSCAGSSYNAAGTFTVPLSTTFYAVWTPDPVTVYFDWNNGTNVVEHETGGYGTPMTTVKAPDESLYSFTTWCSDQQSPNTTCIGTTIDPANATFSVTMTYYALFTGDSETINFDANGGTGGSTVQANYATSATLPSEPTYTGYNFEGWCDTQESPNASCADTALATTGDFTVPASTTYYALWQSIPRVGGTSAPVTVSFDAQGGTPETPITVANGSSVTLPTPTYAGFTFLGWYDAGSGGTRVASPLTLTSTTELYAQWATTAPATVVFSRLAAIHTFGVHSAVLTSLEKHELRTLASRLKHVRYTTVRLVGETPHANTTASQRLALARDAAVKYYLESLGVHVTYLESTVTLATASSSRVVLVYAE